MSQPPDHTQKRPDTMPDLPEIILANEPVMAIWKSVTGLIGNMLTQIRAMTGRGKRGMTQNLAIAEGWLRMGLLQLAEAIVLPKPRPKTYRMQREIVPVVEKPEPITRGPRSPGFRAIEPDEFDRRMRQAFGKKRFDISQFAGVGRRPSGPSKAKAKYYRRITAMMTVLENPERYAKRVKRVLELREMRPKINFAPPATYESPLQQLLRMPRNSDIIRTLTYWDPG